jgi:hypothetical protein
VNLAAADTKADTGTRYPSRKSGVSI